MFTRLFTKHKLKYNFASFTKDPFTTLGLSRSANSIEIKKAYAQLVKKYHPDVNKTEAGNKRFKEIKEAYSLISNDKKRSEFLSSATRAATQPGTNPGGSRARQGQVNLK